MISSFQAVPFQINAKLVITEVILVNHAKLEGWLYVQEINQNMSVAVRGIRSRRIYTMHNANQVEELCGYIAFDHTRTVHQ